MRPEFLDFEPIEPKKYSPFFRFLAGFIAVCLILLSIEAYFYLMHPEPVMNIALADLREFLPSDIDMPFSSHASAEVKQVIQESSGVMKQVANKIAVSSCRKADNVCQSKALFYFVRDNIKYVSDARFHDKLENPLVTLKTGGADCEDKAVLVAALQNAIGNQVRLVFVPGHVYAQVKIAGYKDKWLNMEATCNYCQFNEVPTDTVLQRKRYLNI